MRNFTFQRADSTTAAVDLIAQSPNAKFLGGGTNLVDLMRSNLERPSALIDVTGLEQQGVDEAGDGGLTIGAAVRNSVVAGSRVVRERYPVLAEAILSGASGQIRNMATVGGNLLQRTRCVYFYDVTSRCNKRTPESGCDALDGFNRGHAILGASADCVATHPSDMCVALAALDALVHVEGPLGRRTIPLTEFHLLPGSTPERESQLLPDELITHVQLPGFTAARKSRYRKVRDRASFAFALVSVAAVLEVQNGNVTAVRLALGGVAAKPWRAFRAEALLTKAPATELEFARAAEAELESARGLEHNHFKIELARRLIVATLQELADEGARK